MYRLIIPSQVTKELAGLPKKIQSKIIEAMEMLQVEPRPYNSVLLVGFPDTYRLRFGDYRLVYRIDDSRLVIVAVRIGHRREVYQI